MIKRLSIFALLLCLAFAARAQPAARYQVSDPGVLPAGTSSYSAGLNNVGQSTGYSRSAPGNIPHIYFHAEGTMRDPGTFTPNGWGWGGAVNNAGQVVGSATSGDGYFFAFVSNGRTLTFLPTLGGPQGDGEAINDAGQVTGWAQHSDNLSHAFIYSQGTMTDLGSPGGTTSVGNRINNAGQVTGVSDTAVPGEQRAFLYSGGVMANLGTLRRRRHQHGFCRQRRRPGAGLAYGPDFVEHAVLYSAGVMTQIGSIPGVLQSEDLAINSQGDVLGMARLPYRYHAFLHSGGVLSDLNDLLDPVTGANWTIAFATGINDAGQIVAHGCHLLVCGSTGVQLDHALLLTPMTP